MDKLNLQSKVSKSLKNYFVDIVALLPFLILLATGIIMLMYHAGKANSETVLNKDGTFWLNTHIVFAVLSLILIVVHLSLHLTWFKKLFTRKLKSRHRFKNLMLVFLFFLTTITGVFPWLIFDDSNTANMMLGIHNKLGILLIVSFIVHLFSYSRWLIDMTKKVFGNKPVSKA